MSFHLGRITSFGILIFAVSGTKLSNLSKRFAKMPTKDFLARLLKNKTSAAATARGNSTVEKGNESHSKLIAQSSKVVANSPANEVVEALSKEKKRHRDGHPSGSHHNKKLKEPMNDSGRGEVPLSAKSGVEVRVLSSLDIPAVDGAPSSGLRLCKAYVDEVCHVH